ncbi:hypothetical protein ACJIZ3_010628 [Penstemon smallii]|uniref:Uncharacterized protein n=1 Tax=Penstemon smallii TaxID=265156 RepID=A0ABD3UIZ3_9LAMI
MASNTLSSILSPSFAASWLPVFGTINASSHFLALADQADNFQSIWCSHNNEEAPLIEFGTTPEISLYDNFIDIRLCKFPKHPGILPDKWFLERSISIKDLISHNESEPKVLFAFEPIVETDLQYHKIPI